MAAVSTDGRETAALLGRADALAQLEALAAGARSRQGGAITVLGAQGVGKTALLRATSPTGVLAIDVTAAESEIALRGRCCRVARAAARLGDGTHGKRAPGSTPRARALVKDASGLAGASSVVEALSADPMARQAAASKPAGDLGALHRWLGT